MNDTILVLNGPNLNLLGKRQPEIYGRETLADVEALCRETAAGFGLTVDFRQSNAEHVLIDAIHDFRVGSAGIVRRLRRDACAPTARERRRRRRPPRPSRRMTPPSRGTLARGSIPWSSA